MSDVEQSVSEYPSRTISVRLGQEESEAIALIGAMLQESNRFACKFSASDCIRYALRTTADDITRSLLGDASNVEKENATDGSGHATGGQSGDGIGSPIIATD